MPLTLTIRTLVAPAPTVMRMTADRPSPLSVSDCSVPAARPLASAGYNSATVETGLLKPTVAQVDTPV